MNIKNIKSRSAFLTPTNSLQFKFPPELCSSVDRLRKVINRDESVKRETFRRSFTPIRGSIFMQSPDISPIEVCFKRAPPEKVLKAVADSTVTDSASNVETNQFVLMPPPLSLNRRQGLRNAAHMDLSRQRRNEGYFGIGRSSVQHYSEEPLNQKMSAKRIDSEWVRKNILDAHISLPLQLQEAGLGRFIATFEKEEIDLNVFLIMTEDDLKRIGINNPKDRAAILKFKGDLI